MRLKRADWLLLGQALAFWPVWRWYTARLQDGTDELWGLLSLAAALALYIKTRLDNAQNNAPGSFLLPAILTALYAMLFPFLPPLGRAVLAVGALGTALCSGYGRTEGLRIGGFLLLSLPVIASLQFYLGYPLRLVAGTGTALLLRLTGYSVVREGAGLNWGGTLTLIDAPCSGIRMLWAGLFFSLVLSGIHRFNSRRTLLVAGLSIVFVVIGNVLRSAALFLLGLGHGLPVWVHSGTGAVGFLLAGILLVWCARLIAMDRKQLCETTLSSS